MSRKDKRGINWIETLNEVVAKQKANPPISTDSMHRNQEHLEKTVRELSSMAKTGFQEFFKADEDREKLKEERE